jgi:integrase/recombinase XerD
MTPLRQEFIQCLRLKGFSESTVENYVAAVAGITKKYRLSPLILSKDHIRNYLIFLLWERKLAPATVNLHMDALKTFFKTMAPGNTVMDECSHVKTPKHIPLVLSLEEVEKLIAAVPNIKHKAAMMLLYSSGLRLHECITLRPEHIESARMKVRVEQGKGRKDRYTVLSCRALDMLRDYYRAYRPKHWLFEGPKGGHYSARSLGNIITNATRRAKIDKKISPHTFRHSFATHMMESGVPLPVIQQLLGHSSIKTTMIYLHVGEALADRVKSPLDNNMLAEVAHA